jgi:predicted nucleic acid-binding protein
MAKGVLIFDTTPLNHFARAGELATYLNRLGNFERNAGEASVLAWAEAHSAAAYVDDQVACNVGRSRGVRVHRTLQLVIGAFRNGALSESKA